MEYVDYENLTEEEIAGMENVTVISKVSDLPMSGSSNMSPYALGMSVRIDLEKRRRTTQTENERHMMLGNTLMDSRGKFGASDKVMEAANILRKLESNCGSVVYREALATRMQLRKMALKNFSAQNYSDALLQAHYSLMLAKKFHMEVSKTPLSGEMAMELLILSKCYAQVNRLDAGRPHLMELKFLVEQTLVHLSGSNGGTEPTKLPVSAPQTIINCDAKVFPSIVYTLGEIMTMYDMHAEAEVFFSKYLSLFEREFGQDSLHLSDAINSVCIYLLRSRQHMKALPLAVKALEIQKKHFGDYTSENPDSRVAEGYCNVGIIYRMVGNPIDALHNFLIAIDMKMRILQDRTHPQVQDIFLSIGCCQHMLGNFHAAASIYREVYITRCDSLGTTHPSTIAVKHLLEDLDRDIQLEAKDGQTNYEDNKGANSKDDGAPASIKALGADMGHDISEKPKDAPSVAMNRIQALYTNKTKHFTMPSTSIMQTNDCLLPHKQILELSKQISLQYTCKRLPIINVPRMARGRLYMNDGQPVMECNQDAADLLLEWDFMPPEVTADGDVVGSDPKLPGDVHLFIPIVEGDDPVKGFYDKPLFVPNPGLFHTYKRFKVTYDFNVTDDASDVVVPLSTVTPRTVKDRSVSILERSENHAEPEIKASPPEPVKAQPPPPKAPSAKGAPILPKKAAPAPPPVESTGTDSPKDDAAIVPKKAATIVKEVTDPANPQEQSQSSVPKDVVSKATTPKAVEKPKEPEVAAVSLGELLQKKANMAPNSRNAKFLAKIGNLAKIVVKPNLIDISKNTGISKVKVPAPVVKASPPSSDTESNDPTDVSDIDDEEFVRVPFQVSPSPVVMATLVEVPPIMGSLPLDLKSINDPLPMDILKKVRAIKPHKEDGKPSRCMLINQDGTPLALVPWQIDMISLTLAKSCLSLELIEKYAVSDPPKDKSVDPAKESHLAEYRKLLAGEGLHDLGFANIIAGYANQSLTSEGSLASGLKIDIPASVLANLKKQAEELEKKGTEETAKAAAPGMPKVVPILKKAPPAMKKGAPKGLPPPAMKKGLPTKVRASGSASLIDNAKVRRFFWDPIFGDDAKGTLFACPKGMPNVEKPDIEEAFAKAVPKAKVSVSTKPKAINLLPDSKRAYNMNIGLSKFSKYTFKELKDAVMGLDPTILNVEATESLLTLAPTVEEANIVQEYVNSGGDLSVVDRPEQFVAVISSIPMLKQRLEAHHVALTFKEHFQEIITPLERIMDGCESVIASTKLNVLSNIILKIGNTLNEGDPRKGNAEGFKPTTYTKLNEFRTTTKPTKTLLQYICDIAAKDDEAVLELYSELRACEECAKIDITVLEGNIGKFKNDIQKVKNVIAGAERIKDPTDEFVHIMKDFVKDAEPKVAFVQDQHKEVMSLFRETTKYMGYPEKEVDKVRVDELFRHIWGFAKSVEVARKVRLEAIEKEHRQQLAERRKKEQAIARKSTLRTSIAPTNITATPKMVDDMKNTVKMLS